MQYAPSDEQSAVIDSPAPVVVVLGGAGAGKTTTAAAAAARRLANDDFHRSEVRRTTPIGQTHALLPARRVLFLSFSRTSVGQIVDRATSVLGAYQSRIDVVTFHGLAWRAMNNFGRHYGTPHPLRVRSAAETQLRVDLPGVTYDELIPAALRILKVPAVSKFYERRYNTVICDEFQDTSDSEWEFMQAVAPSSQRLLLGDVNQCIYAGMKQIDPAARVDQALALTGAVQILLPPQSYRDPSGVLPAAAHAALDRRFDDPAIAEAVRGGRLIVHRTSNDQIAAVAVDVISKERSRGKTVSVYTHTNTSTAELSTSLSTSGIDHEQVGFTEAFGDGLQAQFQLLRWAIIQQPGARQALAIYLRSIVRGQQANGRAQMILNKSNQTFETALGGIGDDLNAAMKPIPDTYALLEVVRSAHSRLGFPRGEETWLLVNRRLQRAARLLNDAGGFRALEAEVERLRAETLVDTAAVRPNPVQLMNLHQTKGREADATVLVLQEDEYHGHEIEPFPTGSRLLYVCMTRGRERAHIVVPDRVHRLWLPLIAACMRVADEPTG